VQSDNFMAPALPVRIPATLPVPSITTDPESPGSEKAPDLELRG
jgi:hypothetical protein